MGRRGPGRRGRELCARLLGTDTSPMATAVSESCGLRQRVELGTDLGTRERPHGEHLGSTSHRCRTLKYRFIANPHADRRLRRRVPAIRYPRAELRGRSVAAASAERKQGRSSGSDWQRVPVRPQGSVISLVTETACYSQRPLRHCHSRRSRERCDT